MESVASTEWLATHLHDAGMRLLDLRGGFSLYQETHLPGAQFLHIETLRLSEQGVPCKMPPLTMLATIFGRLGIRRDTLVVAYAMRPFDHISATYTLWSLAVTGNPHGRVLDGGLRRWLAEGRPLTQQYPPVAPVDYTPVFAPAIFADLAYVRDHLGDPDVVLVDSRTRGLYEGSEGTTMRHGHLPGAILHNYIWDFHADGTYLPVEALRERYARAGIVPEKEIITYCVTGREGSAVWFMLKCLLGYPRVRLYQASLSEWVAYPELPLVTGPDAGLARAA